MEHLWKTLSVKNAFEKKFFFYTQSLLEIFQILGVKYTIHLNGFN